MKLKLKFRQYFDTANLGVVVETAAKLAYQEYCNFISPSNSQLFLSSILLNTAAGSYGDAAIAGMSITTKIIMFVASVMIGIGQGFSPVSGYNYGAKRYDRVKQAYKFTLCAGSILMGSVAVVIFIFARQIMNGFINDSQAVEIGVAALRWQVAFIPFHPPPLSSSCLSSFSSFFHLPFPLHFFTSNL